MLAPARAYQTPPLLSLAFFGVAFGGLVLAQALLVRDAEAVLRHYLLSEGLALTHVTVLLWLSPAIMGALYQLLPVLVQAPVFSARLAFVQFGVYLVGTPLLIYGLDATQTGALAVGAAVAVAGVLLFLLNMLLTLRRIQVWSAPARYLAASLGFFTLTVSLGLLFALDLRFGWFSIPAHLLAAHVMLGVVGWFSLTLVGVSYRLLPMFALVRGHDERLANANLVLLAGALLALVRALLLDLARPWVMAPAAALGAGFLVYGWDVRRMLRARLKRRLDLYFAHLYAMLGCLLLLVPAAVLTTTGLPQRALDEVPWTVAVAYLAFAGWLTFAVMGHAYKIVPMLVWQQRYRERANARPPLLTEMYDHRLAVTAFALYAVGFLGTLVALAAGRADLVRATALLALLGVLGFVAGMAYVALGRHEPARVGTPAPASELAAGKG